MAVQVQQTPKSPPIEPTPDAERPRRNRLWRRICVAVLLVLGFVLTPVAVLVTYAKTQVLDTDRYVSTVKPLASDPAVQNYVADTVTAELLSQVDVKAYVNQALSAVQGAPALQALPGQAQAVGHRHRRPCRDWRARSVRRLRVSCTRRLCASCSRPNSNRSGWPPTGQPTPRS